MTVGELIAELSTLDQNTRIVTAGYEGGYEDFKQRKGAAQKYKLVLNVHTAWYYGPHEVADDIYDTTEGKEIVDAYII